MLLRHGSQSVKRIPCEAGLTNFGVPVSPPKQDRSENPRSSATMTRKLGRFDGGMVAGIDM